LFDHAKKEVLVYSSSLCYQFYASSEIIDASNRLKEKGIIPKFLIQYNFKDGEEWADIIRQKETVEKLRQIFGANDIFKVLPEKSPHIVYKNGDSNIRINNFTIVDEKAFRYEIYETEKGECAKIDGKYTNAVGCINDEDTAKLLKEVFYTYYNNATLLE
jgi:hypothetical protein